MPRRFVAFCPYFMCVSVCVRASFVLPGENSAREAVEGERCSTGTVSRASEPEAGDGRSVNAGARSRGGGMVPVFFSFCLAVGFVSLLVCWLVVQLIVSMPAKSFYTFVFLYACLCVCFTLV